MSQEVKRFDPYGYDGLSALMHEDADGGGVRSENYDALRLELAEANADFVRIANERDALLAEREWISVEDRLPESGTPVLAFYENRLGKGRRICAEYIAPKSRVADQLSDPDVETVEYDEEVGEYYWLPGWYERIDNWEEYSHLAVTEGDISHWMPLPTPPASQGEQQ